MTHPPSTTKSGLSWWFKLPAAGAALLVLAAICMLLLDNAATSRWDRYADKIRASGEPLTIQDMLAQLPPTPSGETGAKIIERLYPELGTYGQLQAGEDTLVFGRGSPKVDFFEGIPRNTIEPSREFLQQYRSLLTRLEPIRELPPGSFRITHEEIPYNTLLPHITAVRHSAQLCYLSGIIDVCDSRFDGAIAAIGSMCDVAATLQNDPFLIGTLLASRINADAARLMEGTLRSGLVDKSTLDQLQDRFQDILNTMTLARGFEAERALFVDVCDALISGAVSIAGVNDLLGSMSRKPLPRWIPTSMIRDNQWVGTDLLTKYVEAGDHREALFAACQEIKAVTSNLDWKHGLVRALVHPYNDGIDRFFVRIALLRCTCAGIAAERFRLASGSFPSSLDALVPDYLDKSPTDPFADAPMRFSITDHGIAIYSLGPNEKDDGGTITTPDRRTETLDVGFRLLKPEHRGLLLIDGPDEED